MVLILLLVAFCHASTVSDVIAYPLSRNRLSEIAGVSFTDLHADSAALSIPRVAGTSGAQQARQYILSKLPSGIFNVTLDSFTQNTVVGSRDFVNIVATLTVPGTALRERRIILAAHYDSKLLDGFVGSTDSAVPCAMLLDLARLISVSDTSSIAWGLQLVFFDGEEAFQHWTATDSTYGSRHLASLWDGEGPSSRNALQKISLFVLFDLIGAANNKFYSFFKETSLQFKVATKQSHILCLVFACLICIHLSFVFCNCRKWRTLPGH